MIYHYIAKKLEKAYQASQKKVKLDDERFVDMKDRDDIFQVEYILFFSIITTP